MRNIIYIFIALVFVVSCRSESKESTSTSSLILQKDTFISVMTDFRLAESAIRHMISLGEKPEKMTQYYYSFMLKKHKISMNDFNASLKYYSQNPKEMDEIYNKVVVRLSEIQSKNKIE
jgi:hypothetical protein